MMQRALTIHDMLTLFGIKAIPIMGIEGDYVCVLSNGEKRKVTQDQMQRLAVAFADEIFKDSDIQCAVSGSEFLLTTN